MATPDRHPHARRPETRFRCHYCGALLQVTQVVHRPRRRR
jgi:hypothetical protein